MKRAIATAIVVLLFVAGFAFGADVPGAIQTLQGVRAELAAAQGEREAYKSAIASAGEVSKAKDQVIAARDTTIATVTQERDEARSLGMKLKVGTLVVLGGILTIWTVLAFVQKQFADAGFIGFAAAAMYVGSSVVARKDDVIANYGLAAGVLAFVVVGAYLLTKIFHSESGGIDLANGWEQIKKAGLIAADKIKDADAMMFQETGTFADRFWKRAKGKPQKAEAVAAAPILPVQSNASGEAVLSGVTAQVGASS